MNLESFRTKSMYNRPQRTGAVPIRRGFLGHGVGLRSEFFSEILSGAPLDADFMEIISENYFRTAGRAWQAVVAVREKKPLAFHGIGMGIGDEKGPSEAYLRQLSGLIDKLEPALVSDHLCWTSSQGHFSHDLMPLPRTVAHLQQIVENLDRVQNALGRQILMENISTYVEFQENEMSEVEFVNEVVRLSGCGLLLDLNNVYVNAVNHAFSAEKFLRQISKQAVQLVHLAGHTEHPKAVDGRLLVDTHVGPVPDCIWKLYEQALQLWGPIPTLIEWDEDVPSLSRVCAESNRARNLANLGQAQPLVQVGA